MSVWQSQEIVLKVKDTHQQWSKNWRVNAYGWNYSKTSSQLVVSYRKIKDVETTLNKMKKEEIYHNWIPFVGRQK